MKTLEQTLSNVIINYLKPIADAHPEMNIAEFKPKVFAQMVVLLYEGKIDTRRIRRWLEERVGEKELEHKLSLSQEAIDTFDQLEVDALSR